LKETIPEGIRTIEELEKWLVDNRGLELLNKPPEVFNGEALRATHQYLFQDFPKYGLDNPPPGKMRDYVTEGDWRKDRPLPSIPKGSSYVCYSPMSEYNKTEIDRVLEGAQPARLKNLPPQEFADEMCKVYAQLDYIHPFYEGNSRTLRVFTGQLAKASGYELEWEKLNRSETTRDLLCIARDRAVGELAVGRIRSEMNERTVLYDMDRNSSSPSLSELVAAITRPGRSAAFENVTDVEACKKFPELAPAYVALRAIEAQCETDGLTKAQRAVVSNRARENLQQDLEQGKVPAVQVKEERQV
jgi:cell filamentation protein